MWLRWGTATITFLCQDNNTDGSVFLSKDGSNIAWGSTIPATTLTKQAALANGLYPIVVTVSADDLNADAYKDYYLAIRIYNGKQVDSIYVK